MKRALVLGGGGVVGVAWESGLVHGLAEGGVDLRRADLIVGTSAGSAVGTRIAAGHPPEELSQPPRSTESDGEPADMPRNEDGPDADRLIRIFGAWSRSQDMNAARCAEIGALALDARTPPQEAFVRMIAGMIRETQWPDRLTVTIATAPRHPDKPVLRR